MAIQMFLPILLLICILIPVLSFLFNIAVTIMINVVTAIPYYILGKNAGFNYSWVAFLPTGKDYIAFTIPHCQYNLGIFKTNNRKLIFWIWFGFEVLAYIVKVIGSAIIIMATLYFMDYYASSMDEETMTNLTTIIIRIISYGFSAILFVVRGIIHWRKNYDLLKAYDLEQHAMWASIANVFCPLVMFIFSFILVGRSPEYGDGGYYFNEEDEYDEYYYENE